MSFEPAQVLSHGRKTLMLKDFVVHPDFRRQGFGARMLHFFEVFAKKNGYFVLELSSSKHRHKTHHFYEQHGIVHTGFYFRKKLKR